jgi:nicotinamide riboside kinase
MAEPALVVAVLGAESTGKTTLAQALAARIEAETGLRSAWVGEALRDWCDRAGRTPRADEQAAIAEAQHARIDAAAAAHEVVVTDTSALMTTVYGRTVFGDDSLDARAVALHRRHVSLSLVTALDLPWVADGHQRDGAHVREPVDTLLRTLLHRHGLPWVLVAGHGDARVEAALDAVAPLLRARVSPRAGLFTRLQQRDAAAAGWRWVCDNCDVPECEHLMRRRAPPSLS